MIDTNSRISKNSLQNTGTIQNSTANETHKAVFTAEKTVSSTKISTLSQQLSEAQTRADMRDSSLNRDALAAKASDIRGQLTGSSYQNNKAKYDAEIPDTNDSAHLERAKQATLYTNGRSENPFKGFSSEQLSLVIYDEGGSFTTNEKRAALDEQHAQREAWEKKVADAVFKAAQENNMKAMKDILGSVLDHYENLPPIEHAQVDQAWLTGLKSRAGQQMISNNSNDISHITSLFEKMRAG